MTKKRKRRRQAVTLKDIAQEAGVATSTVSAVLAERDYCYVSDEKRQRIIDTAQRLKYVPNQMSRALRGIPTRTIGLTLSIAGAPVHHAMFEQITRLLWKADYAVLTGTWDNTRTDGRKVVEMLMSRGIDGMILGIMLGKFKPDDIIPDNLPYVNMSHQLGASDISTDRHLGIELAVEHLLGHGRRRIGLVSQTVRGNQEKIDAFRDAAARHDGEVEPVTDFIMEQSDNDLGRLVRRVQSEKVDALVCNNDYMAAEVLRALTEAGIDVPGKVALVGFDNMEICELTNPPLTSISQPVEELARRAVALLFARMEDPEAGHEQVLVPPQLVVRRSCGCEVSRPKPAHGLMGTQMPAHTG